MLSERKAQLILSRGSCSELFDGPPCPPEAAHKAEGAQLAEETPREAVEGSDLARTPRRAVAPHWREIAWARDAIANGVATSDQIVLVLCRRLRLPALREHIHESFLSKEASALSFRETLETTAIPSRRGPANHATDLPTSSRSFVLAGGGSGHPANTLDTPARVDFQSWRTF